MNERQTQTSYATAGEAPDPRERRRAATATLSGASAYATANDIPPWLVNLVGRATRQFGVTSAPTHVLEL